MIKNMEENMVTLGIYFEINDSSVYGGIGTVEYANINVSLKISSLKKNNVCDYVESQMCGISRMCHVDVDNVRIISKDEYDEKTERDG